MSSLVKRNKVYYLFWYQGTKVCPICSGKKNIAGKLCSRCRGTGEIYQSHGKAVSPDHQTALEYKAEFDRKFFRNELGLRDTKKIWTSFVEEYLVYSKAKKRPATFSLDNYVVKTFTELIKPASVKDVTSLDIEKWTQERLKSITPTSLNIELCQIKAAFSKAIEWKLIYENPAKNIKKIKSPPKTPRFLSKEEIKKLLDVTKGQLNLIIKTFIVTGFRLSELINFRWEDIDWDRKIITIQAHDDFQPKDYQIRTIPMLEELYIELNNIKKTEGYVFINQNGNRLDASKLQKEIKLAIKKAGLKPCRIHDMRHTFASQLVLCGSELRDVKELLGHSSYTTTLKYAHLTKSRLNEAINKLEIL
ncbi:MAG: hypothetical protein A2551_08240 [Elusimicrobia bacterium RIFOXYD2_FULL_34_30]|nr:MAG: hypothetical protein A2551_08240 [Elusimicrobia bacterium RIFOXYD2_FULL_34_30]